MILLLIGASHTGKTLWAQKLLEKLREAELISEGELDKITAKNRQSFSPYLARIMP